MKTVLIVSLTLTFGSFSQDVYRMIEKAEKQIKNRKYNKAMRLLEEADSANYSFCGITGLDARHRIAMNKLKVYDIKHNNMAALAFLNTSQLPLYVDRDSLKMIYLIKVYDKESIQEELNIFIENYKYSEFEYEVNVFFSFFDKPYSIDIYNIGFLTRKEVQTDKERSKEELFRFLFREQPFYRLLTNE